MAEKKKTANAFDELATFIGSGVTSTDIQAVYRDYWEVPGKRWINVDQGTRNEISDKFYAMIRRGKPSDPDQLDRLIRDAGQQSWRNRDKGIRRRAQKRKAGIDGPSSSRASGDQDSDREDDQDPKETPEPVPKNEEQSPTSSNQDQLLGQESKEERPRRVWEL
ncbi:hypothetical protein L873DRAFT_1800039 [Choiromyces venosus 120613-1]|uniref:Uncharacterized protein n=1 Tax=Choiromyces venosus 120613-1 TaxID=1336337 RepID=A0A3N4K164_9PEZI|nr:hypothetical protein L873DRAFT_1800039 [Choiromyces venosus 120613-1]